MQWRCPCCGQIIHSGHGIVVFRASSGAWNGGTEERYCSQQCLVRAMDAADGVDADPDRVAES